MRAAKIDANQPDIVKALRKLGYGVQSLASVGKGVPDLLVCKGKVNVLLEVKDSKQPPSKRVLTPDQIKWHREWAGRIFVVDSVEYAIEAMADV